MSKFCDDLEVEAKVAAADEEDKVVKEDEEEMRSTVGTGLLFV